MDYKGFYDRLISRAQTRTLTEYCEIHHILPRCMGGEDNAENLVELTPEEHFVAHELLVKIYPNEDKLIFALLIMSGKNPTTNKLFGWHRRKLSETQKKLKTGVKRGAQSQAHRDAIGAANAGENNGMHGKTPWNKGLKTGIKSSGSFQKGDEPWNKGKPTGVKSAGCFPKGNVPWNKGLSKKMLTTE